MEPNGSRIAVVTNGSPLFTGDAGSGESEIRKWIITNDWLDCIVALPKDLFYNTGIYTYIWFITNKKESHRKGKVQLINAVDFCRPEKKSLGNKRNKLYEDHLAEKFIRLLLRTKTLKSLQTNISAIIRLPLNSRNTPKKAKLSSTKMANPNPTAKNAILKTFRSTKISTPILQRKSNHMSPMHGSISIKPALVTK
jgi:type I restriction enzyme M protein